MSLLVFPLYVFTHAQTETEHGCLLVQSVTEDIATERETYAQSRQGLDSLYIDVQKKLQEETSARQVRGDTRESG